MKIIDKRGPLKGINYTDLEIGQWFYFAEDRPETNAGSLKIKVGERVYKYANKLQSGAFSFSGADRVVPVNVEIHVVD